MEENKATEEQFELEEDAMFPEGWSDKDGADFFNPETWANAMADADAQKDGEGSDEGEQTESGKDGTPTTETEEAESSTEAEGEGATTTDDQKASDGKLRFKANVDHREEDIELDPSELPILYQKARALDRYQAKAKELTDEASEWDKLATGLKYSDRKAMREGIIENFIQNYVDEHPGVPEEIARDFVLRQFQNTPAKSAESKADDAPAGRDYAKEVKELFDAYPETRDRGVPREVMQEAADKHLPLVQVYARHLAKSASERAKTAERENKILKQNQAAAAKAPAVKVTGGGKTDTKDSDLFLRAFEGDSW